MSTQWNPDAKSSTTTTQRVDEANERMIFTHPGMDTYYRNSRGRVVVVNPFPVVEFWHMTREADLSDFELSSSECTLDAGV